MDEDLERMAQSAAAVSSATQPLAAEAANATSMMMRPPATRHAIQREVVLDPRLLTKPGECPTERGAAWRLWRTKLEGWIYGVNVQIGQAMEEAARYPNPITSADTLAAGLVIPMRSCWPGRAGCRWRPSWR